ncbi:MAG: ABC transporter permease [Cyanobacteriota bacterium]|nr:ABC transporter permease [Cyanobacteriota bacterium]
MAPAPLLNTVLRGLRFSAVFARMVLTRAPAPQAWLQQVFLGGFPVLAIVLPAAGIIGMIVAFQVAREVAVFGGERIVGGAVAIALARELIVIVTAVVVAAQKSAGLAADLRGHLGEPEAQSFQSRILPALWASCALIPILAILSFPLGLAGGGWFAWVFYDIPGSMFLNSARVTLQTGELLLAGIKGLVFGVAITWTAAYWGLEGEDWAPSAGDASAATVLTSLVLIVAADLVLSLLLYDSRGTGAILLRS